MGHGSADRPEPAPEPEPLWFDQLAPRSFANGVIQVTVADAGAAQLLPEPVPAAVHAGGPAGHRPAGRGQLPLREPADAAACSTKAISRCPLNPDYVFENFVTGPCNRLPHAAALAVAEQPGKAYNPLFIHGGVGLGKTHLLQAICQKVLERQRDARILYLSCDSFINQFINAVETGDMNQFRYRYRHVDVLVIDDIHFLAGRDRTQEEFFHTFNTLYQSHKQIILVGRLPAERDPRAGRAAGQPLQLGPGRADRKAVLRDARRDPAEEGPHARAARCPMTWSATSPRRSRTTPASSKAPSPRSRAWRCSSDGKIDLDLAKAALGETDTAEQKRITIQQILDAVTKYYNVRPSDLQSKKRHKSIAFPRQVCMFLARRHTRYSPRGNRRLLRRPRSHDRAARRPHRR